ncbi:MAG: IS3 family transposase, partial [Ghiorsea sp.]
GIARSTLYKWKNNYGIHSSYSSKWNSDDKFKVLIETASLNEVELAEYCRKKGLYAEQIQRWKEAAIMGNSGKGDLDAESKKATVKARKEIEQLKRELHRKDKALAEAAALLILSKNLNAIWGDPEVE